MIFVVTALLFLVNNVDKIFKLIGIHSIFK